MAGINIWSAIFFATTGYTSERLIAATVFWHQKGNFLKGLKNAPFLWFDMAIGVLTACYLTKQIFY